VIKRMLFTFILPKQYTVGFVRELDMSSVSGQNLASLLEITTCKKCGEWCELHPLEGEMLANARLKSLEKYGE
jgi:hypothetical protein